MTYKPKKDDSQQVNRAKGDVSSTPAKPSERVRGSDKNKKGSASSGSGKITFSDKVITALKNKVKAHNEKSKSKVTLGTLKAVYRRGAGAFSTSHRPNMTRQQWAMARVNSFLSRGHSQDDDLRKSDEQSLLEESILQDCLDIVEKSFSLEEEFIDIEKGKTSQVTRDSKGNLVYRGIKFAGYSKPRNSDNPKKDRMVLVKEGDKVAIVRYGDASMRQNYSTEANDRFYDRFGGRPEADDKFSATYWSLRDLWPRGKLKGKGARPLVPLKKAEELELDSDSFEEDLVSDTDYVNFVPEEGSSVEIVKQLEEEEMIAIEPLYINVGEADGHEDGISDEELDKLIDNFNKNIDNIKGNIHHAYMTEGFKPVKAYRMPLDVYIGDPSEPTSLIKIEEGQPVVKVQFAKDEVGMNLWKNRKGNILRGVSIGAKGRRVENPDYKGDSDEES